MIVGEEDGCGSQEREGFHPSSKNCEHKSPVDYKRGKDLFQLQFVCSPIRNDNQLTADGFEKLPDQIMYPYAEPYDLQKHVLAAVTSDVCVVNGDSLARLPIPGGLDSSESYKLILSVRVRPAGTDQIPTLALQLSAFAAQRTVWNCALHSASDVVFDCYAHAHIGAGGEEGGSANTCTGRVAVSFMGHKRGPNVLLRSPRGNVAFNLKMFIAGISTLSSMVTRGMPTSHLFYLDPGGTTASIPFSCCQDKRSASLALSPGPGFVTSQGCQGNPNLPQDPSAEQVFQVLARVIVPSFVWYFRCISVQEYPHNWVSQNVPYKYSLNSQLEGSSDLLGVNTFQFYMFWRSLLFTETLTRAHILQFAGGPKLRRTGPEFA
uniref:Uncharacterized protein n=1 Tax=Timema cristinae TaxID=61476 RepID=A0A7R9H6D9_TIMCR|nr:unnamed protein product [Timema cristinae]